MRTLITGANGFLGHHLAKRLAERGDSVRVLVRPTADVSSLEGIKVETVFGDVTEPATLPAAMKDIDVVFHLAGIRRAAVREEFIKVNAEGTRHVCEAMVAARTRRLVFCGSLAASGPSTADRPRREDDPFSPEEWYGESKAEAEKIAFSFKDRLEVTSCRPSRILGPLDHENLTFFKVVKKVGVLRLMGPPRPLSMVDVDDVVDLLLLQAEKPEAIGEAFFASSDEATSLEELLKMIADSLGLKPRTVPVPQLALSALGEIADVITRTTGKRMPLNRKLARQLLATGWTCSISKAKQRLGYQPKVTVRQSIERSAKSYLDAGWL